MYSSVSAGGCVVPRKKRGYLTDAVPRSHAEGHVREWFNFVLVFIAEPFRVELVRVGVVLRVHVNGVHQVVDYVAFL